MSIEKTIEHYGEDCAGYRCPICHNALEAKYEALAAEVAELRETLGHYADSNYWACDADDSNHLGRCVQRLYTGNPGKPGYSDAKAVLDKYK